MKTLKNIALVSLIAAAPSVMAASGTFGSSISVLAPVAISKTADLDFGTIYTDQTTNVTVATADAGAAAFNITGESGKTVDVSVDASVAMTDGANTINVISIAPDLASPTLTAGTTVVKIGGVADIASAGSLVAGSYSGSVNITVAYQ